MTVHDWDVLLPCAHCGGQPIVLVVPHGGSGGLTACRIECSSCRISTPEVVFGGRRRRMDDDTRRGIVADPRWITGLQDARQRCAEIWDRRGGIGRDELAGE